MALDSIRFNIDGSLKNKNRNEESLFYYRHRAYLVLLHLGLWLSLGLICAGRAGPRPFAGPTSHSSAMGNFGGWGYLPSHYSLQAPP